MNSPIATHRFQQDAKALVVATRGPSYVLSLSVTTASASGLFWLLGQTVLHHAAGALLPGLLAAEAILIIRVLGELRKDLRMIRSQFDGLALRYTFDEDAILAEVEDEPKRIAWSSFAHAIRAGPYVCLVQSGGSSSIAIPYSAFGSREDRDAFLDLVRAKLGPIR